MVARFDKLKTNMKMKLIQSKLPRYIVESKAFFSTAADDLISKQNIPINQLMRSHSMWLLLHAFIILPLRSANRMREDRASLREAGAAFLLVTFCCDRYGNTKCQKQIKRFAIIQLVWFLLNRLVHLPTRPVLLSVEP